MRGGQVSLDQNAVVGVLGEQMDMHLVRTDLSALVAEMGEIEGHRLVLGLAEGQRDTTPVVIPADQDVVSARQSRAADQAVDAM